MLTARIDPQTELLVQARSAYRGGDWQSSYAAFSSAGALGPLGVEDLDAMATAAWWLGLDRESLRLAELVQRRLVRADLSAAATKAVELGLAWLLRGDTNVARGWLEQARGLLAGSPEGAARGQLAYLDTVVAVLDDDADTVARRVAALRELAGQVDMANLTALRLVQLLEADANHERLADRLLAVSRALEDVDPEAAGQAYYQLGEVRRLRGEARGAAEAFARARALRVEPQPGEAMLRLGEGDPDRAWAELLEALASGDPRTRLRKLRGAVDLALLRDEIEAAERYCDELEAGSADSEAAGYRPWAVYARGAVLVYRGRHSDALTVLSAALRQFRWQQPSYETARLHDWMARAHRGLGAEASATAAEAAAEEVYRRIGVVTVQLRG